MLSCITFLRTLLIIYIASDVDAMLTGSVARCDNEGQPVNIPLISHNPCISCTCTDGEVVCSRRGRQCRGRHQSSEAQTPCYLLLNGKKDACCDQCKGCMYKGREYESGSVWSDPNDPCTSRTCDSGVVTSTRIKCPQWCSNTNNDSSASNVTQLSTTSGFDYNSCCPAQCPGCNVDGKTYKNGDKVEMTSDPCTTCTCQDGSMYCERKSCPVLPCPISKRYQKPGTCCPQCVGSRKLFELENRCLLGMKLYKSGQTIKLDKCTSCLCQGSTMLCERETCDDVVPECDDIKQDNNTERCCPVKCDQRTTNKTTCKTSLSSPPRYVGEVWKRDACTECKCGADGQVRCSVQECPDASTINCARGSTLTKVDGQCCKQCVQGEAVCTVFGDPHYQTFDGKIFNFQGSCKYLLTKDCNKNSHNSSFTVKVRNDARQSTSFSWTKTVTMQVEDVKIALEQHMVVRVNHKRVELPYVRLGVVTITTDGGYNILVRANSGLNIIWDGDSFLELTVPSSFNNQLCGLCGNFNNKKKDDFKMKKGKMARNSVALGRSWRVGSKLKCGRPQPMDQHDEPMCKKSWDVRIRAVKMCNAIKSSVFAKCHKVVSPVRYFKSCLVDMCECSQKRRCYCEALTAYAHACTRAGVYVNWRQPTKCQNLSCPKGATYKLCGPGCKQTCRNFQFKKVCAQQCVAGCQCPIGTVLHKNECIKPSSCPVRKRPYRVGNRRTKHKKNRKRDRRKRQRHQSRQQW